MNPKMAHLSDNQVHARALQLIDAADRYMDTSVLPETRALTAQLRDAYVDESSARHAARRARGGR